MYLTQIKKQNVSNTLSSPFIITNQTPRTNHHPDYSTIEQRSFAYVDLYVNRITQYMLFCVWLLSLCIYGIKCSKAPDSIYCMKLLQCIHLAVGVHQDFHFGAITNSIALNILYTHLIYILELMYVFLLDIYAVMYQFILDVQTFFFFFFFSLFPFIRVRQLGKEKYHPQCITFALLWEVTNGTVFLKALNSNLQIITSLFSPFYVLNVSCILFRLILIRNQQRATVIPVLQLWKVRLGDIKLSNITWSISSIVEIQTLFDFMILATLVSCISKLSVDIQSSRMRARSEEQQVSHFPAPFISTSCLELVIFSNLLPPAQNHFMFQIFEYRI